MKNAERVYRRSWKRKMRSRLHFQQTWLEATGGKAFSTTGKPHSTDVATTADRKDNNRGGDMEQIRVAIATIP